MPRAGNIAKLAMTSNGKQFTVTREMLTAVARDEGWPDVGAGISARLSKFCFPRISKIHCSPRDQSLSVKDVRAQKFPRTDFLKL